jgi:hypothetical protein
MRDPIRPGAGILFMKVGTHAGEPLEKIIARKQREIADAGFALWGYGGNTCHPQTMVQPFANGFLEKGEPICLVMEEMESKHLADPVRAEQSSPDGIEWTDIPEAVNVVGSRFALRIKSLQREIFDLPLSQTRVAVGRTRGRPGHLYITGHVDKACLVVTAPLSPPPDDRTVRIGLVAELEPPFALFLRNRPPE